MTGVSTYLMLSSLFAVLLVWILPRRQALNAVALVTLTSIAVISPLSALWLAGSSLITVLTIQHMKAARYRGPVVLIYCCVLVSLLFMTREMAAIFWIGGAYFTLRHMHVLLDWWMGRLRVPTTVEYLRYSLFLPVIMAGPIHRLDNFQRQVRRQRVTPSDVFNGAERALFGLAQVVVISSWALRRLRDSSQQYTADWTAFFQRWLDGGFEWLQMFFSFAGLTSLALGLSLMAGLRLEENFNRPWASRNLIDFWSRWHMTLSNWCRDYVFYPVAAVTRLPIVGLLLAMLAMGLWHDDSAYYVLWAVWQALGIYLTHVALRLPAEFLPGSAKRIIGTLSVFLWLSLTKPMVLSLLDFLES
jgi:alginate O-acetyltransferase complex protein AlgI